MGTHPKADSGWVFAVFCPFRPISWCCLASSDRCRKHMCFSIRMSSSLLKCLLLMVASVVKKKPDHDQVTLRQEKRAQRLTFWVRRPPGGVEVFHAKGWGPKSSCPPPKVCLPWVSKRGIWDVPGFLPQCPGPLVVFKKFVRKSSWAFFVP